MAIKIKSDTVCSICTHSKYQDKLQELNRQYPGRLWKVTVNGKVIEIDLRESTCHGRADLTVPAEVVQDKAGQIIGCKSLTMYKN